MSVYRGLGECPGSTKTMQEDDGAFILNAMQPCCISLGGAVLKQQLEAWDDSCSSAYIAMSTEKND